MHIGIHEIEARTAHHQGAVTSLITYGAVTVAWIDRLAAINEEMGGIVELRS